MALSISAGFSNGRMQFSISFNSGGGGRRVTGIGRAQWPQDLQGDQAVLFTALEDKQASRVGKSRSIEAGSTIALPLPANLATAYNAQYSNEGIGPIGKLAMDAGKSGYNNAGEFASRMADRLGSIDQDERNAILANLAAGVAETEIGALAGGLVGGGPIGAAAGAAAASAFKGGMAGAGIARNPHLAALFTGTNFRTHTFAYKLVARNKAESDAIKEIIYAFKLHSAPRYFMKSHMLRYPSKWQIKLQNGPGNYLFDLGNSVCTNVEVNYSGEGGSYFFDETGAPVSVSLSVTMQEVDIITQDEIVSGR